MTTMYDSFELSGLTIKNRLVRSATFEFAADNGRITPGLGEFYRRLADGGIGLIISGMQVITPGAMNATKAVETTYNGYEDDLRGLVETVHESGGKIFVQLNHTGFKTSAEPGHDRFSVSDTTAKDGTVFHEATADEIKRVVAGFAEAARRCKAAGCDGVQIHAAHGYLISTFLSPYFNHRTDAYGGTIENRARILYEVYDAIRAEVGEGYPIGVKLHYSDNLSPSITPEECLHLCKALERRGIAMIEVSSGVSINRESTPTPVVKDGQEGVFLDGAARVAAEVNIPVISVCGYRTPEFIEKALNETGISAVALARPLVREPELPNRWRTDRSKALCISCNQCFKSGGILACQAEA